MNYKSFLRMKYICRGEDIEGEKFEVRKIAFINFGSGEKNRSGRELTTKLAPRTDSIYKVYNGHERKAKNCLVSEEKAMH